MPKLPTTAPAVKSLFPRNRISYPFSPVPDSMLERLDHPTAERLYRALCSCIRQGWTDPPVRYLAAQIRRSYMQTMRGLKILEKAGYVRRIRRRISRTRCATNVYEIIGFSNVNVTEKQSREDLKAKASRARRIPRPRSTSEMHTRLRWAQNRIASLETRVKYYERGQQIEQARLWSSQKDAKKLYMQSLAQVGVYRGPCQIPEDEIERLRAKLGR